MPGCWSIAEAVSEDVPLSEPPNTRNACLATSRQLKKKLSAARLVRVIPRRVSVLALRR